MLPEIFLCGQDRPIYNILSNKKLLQRENLSWGKDSKLRITVLLFIKSDGTEKLQPLVTGKFQNPQCFKNIKTLPTKVIANSKA
jgi:hypothetical protein